MRPTLFEIPGLGPISSYQTLLAVGFLAAIPLALRLARGRGVRRDHVLDIALIAVVAGILGSRLFYYFEFYEQHFRARPWYHVFYVHLGGYVFYGGLIGALVGVLLYLGVQKRRAAARGETVRLLGTLDVCAAPLALGLSFGRIGCLLNGCCWGLPAGEGALLALTFPRGSYAWENHCHVHGWIPESAAHSLPVHATQVYAWAAALLLTLLMVVMLRLRRREGQVSGAFLLLYGPLRFVLEAFREHSATAEMSRFPLLSAAVVQLREALGWSWLSSGQLTYSQAVSVCMGIIGVAWFALASWRGPRPPERAVGA